MSEESMFDWHRNMVADCGDGGISDMTLFHWSQKTHPEVLGDSPAIFGDSPFDVSLEEVCGFQADDDGFKRLVWENRSPSAVGGDGRLIALASLHHQGRLKTRLVRMPMHSTRVQKLWYW
jgi:hypothetical protein